MEKNMTAIISCFARGYHYCNNSEWIYEDEFARKLLSEDEYNEISRQMGEGIHFFNPNFTGSPMQALRYIVDTNLAPTVLGRSAFNERALDNAVKLGCKQYVLFASGYDTFALKEKYFKLNAFELDHPDMIEDKMNRILKTKLPHSNNTQYVPCDFRERDWSKLLVENGFCKSEISFGSLLGICYYLSKDSFVNILKQIALLWSDGSSICFDYPCYDEGIENIQNRELAKEAKEEMQAKYSYKEIEGMLSECGFLIYEHLDHESMTKDFFETYNTKNPDHKMSASKGTNYCLAVKKKI